MSRHTGKAEEMSGHKAQQGCCPPRSRVWLLFSRLQGVYRVLPGRQTGIHKHGSENVTGNRKGFPAPAVPSAHTRFFPPLNISAELSTQLEEVNLQLDISKVFTIQTQVYYTLDYARYRHRVSVF